MRSSRRGSSIATGSAAWGGARAATSPRFSTRGIPIAYIKQAKAPTLIQHGEDDARVPIPNAFQLYQGLRDQNVPVRLSIFKGFGHGLNKPKANRAAMQQNLDWFTTHLWNQPTGSAQ